MLWLDGRFVKTADVSAFSHAVNYSSGVFDTARLYQTPKGSAFFRLEDHVRRLFAAMHFAGFSCNFIPAQIEAACLQLVRKNNLEAAYLRVNAFLPQEEFRVFPALRQASVSIMAAPLNYSGKRFHRGLNCWLSNVRKPRSSVIPARIKFSANYLLAYLALKQARMKGFDEAVLLDSRGFVAEGTAQNIFVVKDGVLFTPSKRSEILPGVTRDSVMTLARDLGVLVRQADVSVRELLAADEVFLTGTATEIMPVTRIGRKRLRVGPLTRTLCAAFGDVVSGRHRFSEKWLTHV